MSDVAKNIAFVGGSGNLGSRTLDAILKHGKHNVTAITRASSTSSFPASVTVKKGDYKDEAWLQSVLEGQDVLIVMMGFSGLSDEHNFYRAAAKAGVKYVLPSEYGMASANDAVVKAAPILQMKRDNHNLIKSLGMKWIGVVTNQWIDYCITYGVFDILTPERKARLYADGLPFNTTTMAQAAAGISNMLCLTKSEIDEEFANNYLYISSFKVTQPEIFESILRVTGAKEDEWQIERMTAQELVDEGWRMVGDGDQAGHFKIIFGIAYKKDLGGDYSDLVHNERLGLGTEDLDTVVKAAVDAAKPGGWTAGQTLKGV